MDNINYDYEVEKQGHPENFETDEESGYCPNCDEVGFHKAWCFEEDDV